MGRRLIDTNIFIDAERGLLDLETFVSANVDFQYFMSVVTVSELLHGVLRASEKYRQQRSATVEKWIRDFPLIDIDEVVARQHARLYSQLRADGKLIGVNDQWLAASCMTHDLTLVTANVKEFGQVAGLEIESWRA